MYVYICIHIHMYTYIVFMSGLLSITDNNYSCNVPVHFLGLSLSHFGRQYKVLYIVVQ